MPQTSGYKFLEDIRRNERTSNIPVIIVSALTDTVSKQKVQKLGIVDYIEKPVDLQAVIELVDKSFII
jgi:putative two-component system response regulator